MSARQKGNRRERKAADLYEAAGYQVERATAGGFQSPDFFDLFDLLAFNPGEGLDLVQVKSNRAEGIEQWCADTLPFQTTRGLCPLMLVCYDYEGWRVIIPSDEDAYVDAVDERELDCRMGEGVTEYLRTGKAP